MNRKIFRVTNAGALAAFATLAGSAALAESIQTLDRVDVYNQANVLEMQFNNPARNFDFAVLGISPANAGGFKTCQITATQGLYCLDGKELRYWQKPGQAAGVGARVLNCTDPALGFDVASTDTCTGMTVGMPGAIWLTGKRANSTSYGLMRVTKRIGASCPVGEVALADPYCAKSYGTTSALVSDISVIDGDVGARFVGPADVNGTGVLGLGATVGQTLPGDPIGTRLRKSVLFFPGGSSSGPVTIANGNQQLGLSLDEQLLSATLLQAVIDEQRQSFVLATTSAGRIIAIGTDGESTAFEVFNIAAERNASSALAPVQCRAGTQHYGIRASSKSEGIYVTDRNFCQALALDWVPAENSPFRLVNVQENGKDLTFSTNVSAEAVYPPVGPTIAPGIVIDLAACAETCIIVYDDNGTRAASLSNVRLASAQSQLTLFQVRGIPDCRWAPALCEGLPVSVRDKVVLDLNGAFVPLSDPRLGTIAANQLFLDVTPLLPLEITGLFDNSGAPPSGLPRMLISPQYRGQEQNDYVFESLVGITEPGVVFQDTFEFEFDVLKLAGTHLGCGYDYGEAVKPNRAWDVTTTVSEKFVTAGGPGLVRDRTNPNRYVDTMLNTGCVNPTKGAGTRWSLYSYNLEISPNTDAVFAKLLATLYDDLEETRSQLACRVTDIVSPGAFPPLRTSTCSTLATQWSAGKALLNQCIASATAPKAANMAAACEAFSTQLANYQATLNVSTRFGTDLANRIGELKARVLTLQHVYADRFLPSIPLGGFGAAVGN